MSICRAYTHQEWCWPFGCWPLAGEKAERVIGAPRGICGQGFVEGVLYLVTTDAEETNEYWLTRVDLQSAGSGEPKCEDVARIPFQARALAWDGTKFWTNHREESQIVAFARVR